jgi:CRISPR-associated protein Cas1
MIDIATRKLAINVQSVKLQERNNKVDIIVDDFGTFLAKKSERIQLKKNGKVDSEYPLFELEQLTIASRGVSLSSDLIEECMARGIQINFLTSAGHPYAKISSPTLNATVHTRREQLLSYNDERGRNFAVELVHTKTKNQISLLKYLVKNRRANQPDLYKQFYEYIQEMEAIRLLLSKLDGSTIDEIRPELLSIEGRIGQLYWSAIKLLLPDELGFTKREHQGATDSVNSLLNYGYGILYTKVWGAILLAGLEPFAGFLHVDRPGKPSLVLDMVEEFRQPIVDRVIIGWLNKGGRPDFEEKGLSKETRKGLALRINERLDSLESYDGKKHRIRNIIQAQARKMSMYVRRQREYDGFYSTW